ncbi:hypothetical protein HPB49_015058 [Dermacentor silvarum]|uniref:Uncharacterized protein n=1 Tax=Dermacentor silvarum TaxID=543639 RepID=A0ACB8D662_DERSI|nr:hypothetical protein HPB49_015058 [Dermacentor silvarum]
MYSQEEPALDIMCPNHQQNIIVISTPNEANIDKYLQTRLLRINDQLHEVSVYETAPTLTTKGVIRGIPLEDNPKRMNEKIVNSRSPTALAGSDSANRPLLSSPATASWFAPWFVTEKLSSDAPDTGNESTYNTNAAALATEWTSAPTHKTRYAEATVPKP